MLEGLDTVDWAGLSTRTAQPPIRRSLLRQAASNDLELVKSALSDLYGSVSHQGTVYPTTIAVVPFLVEVAHGATHERDGFVWMVGSLAHGHHAYGREAPALRAAVAAQSDALVELLGHPDVRVREAAAYAACKAGAVAPLFWARWAVENDLAVRASLVLALGELDIDTATPVLTRRLPRRTATRTAGSTSALTHGDLWWALAVIDRPAHRGIGESAR